MIGPTKPSKNFPVITLLVLPASSEGSAMHLQDANEAKENGYAGLLVTLPGQ